MMPRERAAKPVGAGQGRGKTMCGIVGILNTDRRPVDPFVLESMGASLAHRGPDDEGHLVDGAVGLAHKRLSIIDLRTGHQPMSSDGLTIVFNGEIYNYVELRRELQQRGHCFRTTSDTEVILKTYLEHGLDGISKLNGMFAFLLLDRPRDRLVAARDHFGIKPLYCTRIGQTPALCVRDQGTASPPGCRCRGRPRLIAGLPDVPVRPWRGDAVQGHSQDSARPLHGGGSGLRRQPLRTLLGATVYGRPQPHARSTSSTK